MTRDGENRDENRDDETPRPEAAPRESIPDDQADGVEPMAEVPGGPQVDVPAARGHLPDDEVR
ncbi:hypothetical protein [Pseudonocardia oroxyli]|uniref:Uncharacterized protein n=1 Tax=Pseudonocardia oroxyli TaxID=366584 RepID=A0A1G7G9D9_PSEOR|nr:hypothetical protein [Pseudonocardia oroxyli]SDE84742.1 hypothetical protein SAMN05216377_102265 [Pseudonocardia oroxyli]